MGARRKASPCTKHSLAAHTGHSRAFLPSAMDYHKRATCPHHRHARMHYKTCYYAPGSVMHRILSCINSQCAAITTSIFA